VRSHTAPEAAAADEVPLTELEGSLDREA